jgi:hypothetical protein
MLESSIDDYSICKYICDLYNEEIECHYPNQWDISFYRCDSCRCELAELEVLEDTKNV